MSLVTRVLMGLFVLIGSFIAPGVSYSATHTVSPGESLYTISRDYGIALNSLMVANKIQSSLIYSGQQLYVPEKSSGRGTSYTVKAGDTLYLIGIQFGVNYKAIMSTNGLYDATIYPGLTLTIPVVTSASSGEKSTNVSRGGNFQRPSAEVVNLLAKLITAEAEGEPYEGKVAVGAVVLNRVANANFPKSIQAVIYQYGDGTYQFEPVQNGRINMPASNDSINAAKDALNGWDPTNGAIYFFANYVKSKWLWSRPLSKIIGKHVFTY
ncbi:MAG: cell wall hydrolase [Desulfotomaculaceae bacterium]|nr:cell wall hydrolase [Desulfotomaculaceae bacterium]